MKVAYWAKTSSFIVSTLEISTKFSGLSDSSTHDRKQQNIKELNEQLKTVEYRPRGRVLHETKKGSKKVGIGVQKHQGW